MAYIDVEEGVPGIRSLFNFRRKPANRYVNSQKYCSEVLPR